jgi:TonB-linked SusC/RagA family outer membrane protein
MPVMIALSKPAFFPAPVRQSFAIHQTNLTMSSLKAVALAFLLLRLPCSAQKLNLRGKNFAIPYVFGELKKQLDYDVIYSPRILDDAPPVDLDLRNADVPTTLRYCFAGLELGWNISGKIITVYRKTPLSSSLYTPLQGRLLSSDGEPLEGASISIDSFPEGITGAGGYFRIPVRSHYTTVHFSFLGFSPRTLFLRNEPFHNIGLQSSAYLLDHVVVQAYGRTTPRLVTGSQSEVPGADVGNPPVENVLAALQGRAPGLDIRQYNGVPGSAYGILIRGQHSITQGTDPLIIIDGMPIAGNNGSLSTIGSGSAQGPMGAAALNSIPPTAIASIEVLKDASATAIYGSRGANGVILLTLKQGQPGGLKWSFDVYGGATRAVKTGALLTTPQYRVLREEAIKNDGQVVDATTAPELFNWDSTRSTDYKKLATGNYGVLKDARIDLCGGDTNTVFLVSSTYHSETSVFPGSTKEDRKSFYGHLHHQSPNHRLRIDFSGLYSWGSTRLPTLDYTVFQTLAPNTPPFRNSAGGLQWNYNGIDYTNIEAQGYNQYQATLTNQFNYLQVNYTLLPGLDIKGNLGFNRIGADEHSIQPLAGQNPAYHPTGSRYYTGNTYHNWLMEGLVEYRRRLGPGKLETLMGLTGQDQGSSFSTLSEEGFTSDWQLSTSNPTGVTTTTEANKVSYRYAALFGRLNYTIQNKYLLTVSGRRDGSSRFGPGNQFGNFWAISGGWIFSDEPFVDRLNWLSWGKLRASIGTTGNDQIGNNLFAQVYSNTSSARGYQGLQGVYPVTFANDKLAWEVNYNSELALDLGFLNNKIVLSAAAYRDWTVNQLVYTALPFQAGLPGVFSNQPANVVNKGLEFSLQTHNVAGKDFRWTSSFLLTAPFNQLKRFPALGSSLYAARLFTGKSLSEIRSYHYTGVNPNTGLFTFKDYNKNGAVDPGDLMSGGNFDPKVYGGIGEHFQYKNWQLDLFFEYRVENGLNPLVFWYQLNPPGMSAPSMLSNGPQQWLQRWQRPGDKALLQRLTADPGSAAFQQIFNYIGSDAKVIDASWLRWKSLSLSWSLPEKWTKRAGLRSGKIYIRGQNLLTVTHFPVADPETQNPTVLPPVRAVVAGFQLNL